MNPVLPFLLLSFHLVQSVRGFDGFRMNVPNSSRILLRHSLKI
jgi:hypothetical protein